MSEKIRVGVVGTSWYAENFHVTRFQELPGADLVAICGRNRTRAEALAAQYAIPQVYTDYQDMIQHANLQALVVATPDDLHYPITMAGLEAGLHVLCEKPMALRAADARRMYEKAVQTGVKNMVCHSRRWMPGHQNLQKLIDDGYIGRCYQASIRVAGDYGPNYAWRFDRQRAIGILGDLGSHMIDLALWHVGDIAEVTATLSNFVTRNSPDGTLTGTANDAALLLLRFKNGAQGVIQVCAVATVGDQGHNNQTILYGEDGTLEIRFTIFGEVEIRGIRRGEKEFQVLPIPPEFIRTPTQSHPMDSVNVSSSARAFIDSIQSDRIEKPTFWDGYKVQQVIDAALEADQKKSWVAIDG